MSAENHHSGMDGTGPLLHCQPAQVPAMSDRRAELLHQPKYWNGSEKLRWQQPCSICWAVAQFFRRRLSDPAGDLSFCAAVCKRRCTVSTSAGRLRAFSSHRPTESLITVEGVSRVADWDFSALSRVTLKTGFPASKASSFFARAMRCFKVSFGFADFFRFPFLEPVDFALRRFS